MDGYIFKYINIDCKRIVDQLRPWNTLSYEPKMLQIWVISYMITFYSSRNGMYKVRRERVGN